ncbi:MAG: NAD-binding protein [Nautiliaceae bacterium]
MNILIAGAEKVGYNIAKTLSLKHNVTIDKNEKALEILKESLDILTIKSDMYNAPKYSDKDMIE